MKKLLFIAASVGANSAQGIRYSNLLSNLSGKYSITAISLNNFFEEQSPTIRIETLSKRYSNIVSIYPNQRFKLLLKNIFKKYLEPFLFPDKYFFTLRRIIERVQNELNKEHYDRVLIGLTPFSYYRIAKLIKRHFPEIKIIIDLSDPFTGNKGLKYHYFFSEYLVKRYEKKYLQYVDTLVVLNPAIKMFYENEYRKIIKNEITVVEQGLEERFFEKVKTSPQSKNKNGSKLKLIYGGGFYSKLREPFNLYKAINNCEYNLEFNVYGNIRKEFLPDKSIKIKYKGSVSQEKLIEAYLKSDIIVFIDNTHGLQVPGKTLEILAFKKPILFIFENENSPTLHYVNGYPHIFKSQNKTEDIKSAIDNLISHIPISDFTIDLSDFYWKNLAKKYEKIIDAD